jgi:hypothetical protein
MINVNYRKDDEDSVSLPNEINVELSSSRMLDDDINRTINNIIQEIGEYNKYSDIASTATDLQSSYESDDIYKLFRSMIDLDPQMYMDVFKFITVLAKNKADKCFTAFGEKYFAEYIAPEYPRTEVELEYEDEDEEEEDLDEDTKSDESEDIEVEAEDVEVEDSDEESDDTVYTTKVVDDSWDIHDLATLDTTNDDKDGITYL